MSAHERPTFTVQYYAGAYSGELEVQAEDEGEALRRARAIVRRGMALPMYADRYKVVRR